MAALGEIKEDEAYSDALARDCSISPPEIQQHILKQSWSEKHSSDCHLSAPGPKFQSCQESAFTPLMPFLSLGQRPWVFGDEIIDFSVVLSCLQDPSYCCYPLYSYFTPLSIKSVLSHGAFRRFGTRLSHKHPIHQKIDDNLRHNPHAYSLPFRIDGPVPLSCFKLGLGAQEMLLCSLGSDEGSRKDSGSSQSSNSSNASTSDWGSSSSNASTSDWGSCKSSRTSPSSNGPSSISQNLLEGDDGSRKDQLEDEFQSFYRTYLDMLQEVDATEDCVGHDYLDRESLQKLKPQFRSKYGINNSKHPLMKTIKSLRQQKYFSTCCVIFKRCEGKFLGGLLKLKPYIKGTDCPYDVVERLEETCGIPAELPDCVSSVNLLISFVLFNCEHRFHPLIRESHMHKLLMIVDGLTKSTINERCEQILPVTYDFPLHLQSYVYAFVETKLKEGMYYTAMDQIHLHKEFDNQLASGELDHCMDAFMSSKDKFVKDLVSNEVSMTKFSDLCHDLMKLSLEWRFQFVENRRQICTYRECLRRLLENEELKGCLRSLISELETEGFFNIDDDSVNWDKKCFTQLVDEFNDKVFAGHSFPNHYVIRGIIDYRLILLWTGDSFQDAFEEVVDGPCERWIATYEEIWLEARYYDHHFYDIVRRPLEKVFSV